MKGWSEDGDAVNRSVGAAAILRGGADMGRVVGGSWKLGDCGWSCGWAKTGGLSCGGGGKGAP